MKEVSSIGISELIEMSQRMYGDLVKAVVDVVNKRLVIDAEMHADQESFLLRSGSSQDNLWGINLHPEFFGTDDFVEFDSMINLRPGQGNRSRSVDNPAIREQIRKIVLDTVHE